MPTDAGRSSSWLCPCPSIESLDSPWCKADMAADPCDLASPHGVIMAPANKINATTMAIHLPAVAAGAGNRCWRWAMVIFSRWKDAFIVTSRGGSIPVTRLINMHVHETHPAVIKRLRRAGGHLSSVVAMLEQGKPCMDVVQQLQAVEKAITQAKRTLIQDHLDHCLSHMVTTKGQPQPGSLDEFREITKYL